MDTLSYKTVSANKATANKEWVVVNAEGQTLGRLAARVAMILRGKHKTNFTPHVDAGDNVIVINAEKIQLTGNKWDQKNYVRHSGFPGGQTMTVAKKMLVKKPEAIVEKAVKGMLPKTKLGNAVYKNLHVVIGSEHKFQAQQPKEVNLNSIK